MSVTRVPTPGRAHLWGLRTLEANRRVDPAATRHLTATGEPSSGLPREPWALAFTDLDGSVAAVASPAFAGGLFWAHDGAGLLLCDNVRELVDALAPNVSLDPEFVRGFAMIPRDTPGTRTAFREIGRIEPGTTARWAATASLVVGRPSTVEWCGPQAWPEPDLEGPGTLEKYRTAFDASVDELLTAGPIYTQMSGGLDSTFVAASLVRHATVDNPVHALCHSPSPEAQLRSVRTWDPDDYPVAKAMADAYPGRLVLHRLRFQPDDHPLDAAANAAATRGVPTFNPGNQIWLDRAAQIAAEGGAQQLFSGANGNPAFSYDHDYAPAYYLRDGHPVKAWSSLRREASRDQRSMGTTARAALKAILDAGVTPDGRTRVTGLGRRLASAPMGRTRSLDSHMDYLSLVGLGHLATPNPKPMNRARYLNWLAGRGPLRTAGMFSGSAVPTVDPFTTRTLLDVAAAITPLEWSRGPGPRGYARLLGAGRVPDPIRLRTRRGGQAWDQWYLIRNDRDRYYDEVVALAATPILGGWVDTAVLRAQLDQWPWGEVHGPAHLSLLAMGRILSLGGFVRAASQWCRS